MPQDLPALTVESGTRVGARFPIAEETVIGRGEAEVSLDDQEVSRRHAVVRPTDWGLEIEDLGSTNGTFVNEERTSGATALDNGDTIRVGQTSISVALPASDRDKTIISAGRDETALAAQALRTEISEAPPAAAETPAVAQAQPPPAVEPPAAAQAQPPPAVIQQPPASRVPLGYAYSGQKYVLGYGEDFYGIWDRDNLYEPLQTFPRNDAGWASAWGIFTGWEPNAVQVG